MNICVLGGAQAPCILSGNADAEGKGSELPGRQTVCWKTAGPQESAPFGVWCNADLFDPLLGCKKAKADTAGRPAPAESLIRRTCYDGNHSYWNEVRSRLGYVWEISDL